MLRAGIDIIYQRDVMARQGTWVWRVDYCLLGNIFFLLGVVFDFVTGHYGSDYCYEQDEYFWEYFWYIFSSSLCWLIYAFMEICRCLLDAYARCHCGAPTYYSCHVCRRPNDAHGLQRRLFAWDLLAALLFAFAQVWYLLPALLTYGNAPVLDYYPYGWALEVLGATLYILNSLACFAGQMADRYADRGEIWYVASDLETTRDVEASRDQETLGGEVTLLLK